MWNTEYKRDAAFYIKEQLEEDKKNQEKGQPISWLAKWLPSVNTSSEAAKKMGRELAQMLSIENNRSKYIFPKEKHDKKSILKQYKDNGVSHKEHLEISVLFLIFKIQKEEK